MRGFYYTILFAAALIFPALLVTANVLKKEPPERDYAITHVSGIGNVQYQALHSDAALNKWYSEKATWIPLGQGMKTGSGDRIRTGEGSFVDIMREGLIALRVEENSLLEMVQKETPGAFLEAGLKYGRITCRVIGTGEEVVQVSTETAAVDVKGTTFSVEYLPGIKLTTVTVLEGIVEVRGAQGRTRPIMVSGGRKVGIDGTGSRPALDDLIQSEKVTLEAFSREMKIETPGLERVSQALDLDVFSPILNKVVTRITEAEMRTFVKEIKHVARVRRGGNIPESLGGIELEEGDYSDPWKTDYFYEKLTRNRAVLISAGPDREFHTRDDIVMPIAF